MERPQWHTPSLVGKDERQKQYNLDAKFRTEILPSKTATNVVVWFETTKKYKSLHPAQFLGVIP